MKIRYTAKSDVGLKRKGNEDSYLVDKRLNLFIVCDGMGGHNAGEIASCMAVRVVREALSGAIREIERHAEGDMTQRSQVRDILKEAVREASLVVFKKGKSKKDLRGMGTTLTLMLICCERAFVAHAGDCRLYLYRSGQIHQITTDHNLVNEMIRAGRLKPEDADKVPFTNALTRAVGVYPNVEVDTLEMDLLPGDRFLLCSDGAHNYLDKETVRQGLEQDFEKRSEWFIDHANKSGGKDNITGIVIEVEDEADTSQMARIRLTFETLRQIPLFHHLAYAELVRVINVARAREVPAGTTIIQQDEEGDDLFVLLEGRVSVIKDGEVVAILKPGRHFGEMSIVDNEPRSATVKAVEKSILIRIVRADFYELLRQDSVMAVKLLWNFIQTLSLRLRSFAPRKNTLPPASREDLLQNDGLLTPKFCENDAFAQTDPGFYMIPDEME
jgi:serine/threonine protein phosphatase PrpC/CRP-like cAMP-binding protein